MSIFIEKALRSNITMFVMEILQEIFIHFSFDMIRTFASYSGHALSVGIQTNCCLKLPKSNIDKVFKSDKNLLLFLLQGR